MVRRRRLTLKLSQSLLGEELDISGTNISRWERGVMFPREDKLEHLAQVLKLSVKELKQVWALSRAACAVEESDSEVLLDELDVLRARAVQIKAAKKKKSQHKTAKKTGKKSKTKKK